MELKVTSSHLNPIRDFPRKAKKSVIYVWPEGETIMQNLLNRRTRPYNEYRKAALKALTAYGVDTSVLKLKWSKHAGCKMCPCSPGFIVDGYSSLLVGRDLHLTVEGDDSGITKEEIEKAFKDKD